MSHTREDIDDLLTRRGFVKDDKGNYVPKAAIATNIAPIKVTEPKKKAVKKKVSVKKQADKITAILESNKIPFITEHRFCEERKFRFDFVVLPMSRKLAIEYEGLMSAKSRHTTITGFSTDCTKYNLAATKGWTVLRYTALNYTELLSDLTEILKAK